MATKEGRCAWEHTFEVVLFRALHNASPIAALLSQAIRALSEQQVTPPGHLAAQSALLVQVQATAS